MQSWNHYPVTAIFPFEELEGAVRKEPERAFVVDVGGGCGQALHTIQKHCNGSFGGKLILQDLPIVIHPLAPKQIPGIKPHNHLIVD